MRREVVPGLPLRRICQLLERWEPDESAPDPLPPGGRTPARTCCANCLHGLHASSAGQAPLELPHCPEGSMQRPTILYAWRLGCNPVPLRFIMPVGLMEALQSESPRSEGSTPSPTSRQEEEYLAPDEEALLAEGGPWRWAFRRRVSPRPHPKPKRCARCAPCTHASEHRLASPASLLHSFTPPSGVIEPLSLELGEESEDELESLAAGTGEGFEGGPELSPGGSAAPGDEARASRFALLRALWGNAR